MLGVGTEQPKKNQHIINEQLLEYIGKMHKYPIDYDRNFRDTS